jgi:hypothetical protein
MRRKEARYQLYRRLGGPHCQSGRVRKILPPPGFDSRTVQPVVNRYADWAIPAHPDGTVPFNRRINVFLYIVFVRCHYGYQTVRSQCAQHTKYLVSDSILKPSWYLFSTTRKWKELWAKIIEIPCTFIFYLINLNIRLLTRNVYLLNKAAEAYRCHTRCSAS